MQPGLSFSPLNATPGQQGQSGASPLQDAIKILSFRMPSVVGALGAPGSAGSPLAGGLGNSMADQWLANLFKGIMPADQAAGQTDTQGPAGPTFTNVSPGGSGTSPIDAPTFTNVQPGNDGPGAPRPPDAPPPNVVFGPPDPGTGKVGLGPSDPQVPPPWQPPSPPDTPTDTTTEPPSWTRPPNFRDWLMGGWQGGMPGGPFGR